MSLLNEAMVKCVYLIRAVVPDGYGGYKTVYVNGTQFDAAIVLNDSIEAKIAQAQGVTGLYTITTSKALNLQYHDAFKRISDNKVFRVTSDGDDKHTPASANLNMRQVSAEEWELPSGGTEE